MDFLVFDPLQCYIAGLKRTSTFRKNYGIDHVIAYRIGTRRHSWNHVLSDIRKKLLLKNFLHQDFNPLFFLEKERILISARGAIAPRGRPQRNRPCGFFLGIGTGIFGAKVSFPARLSKGDIGDGSGILKADSERRAHPRSPV